MSKREICSEAKHTVDVSNRYRIPTSSGVTLGACVARPSGAGKFPALVWLDPYRSGSDGGLGEMARYFAERGYAFVYLNARGSGNSEGVSRDEYMVEETEDGFDAIAWLAEQPWCSGKVGMLGASYSGFTALQVASLTPPALKAIAPAYFTDRRYTDDCHYKGGCLRGYYDVMTYGLSMVSKNALPPYPAAVGERWAELWKQRLEESEPYLVKWLNHPYEDEYWAQGSIIGKYDKIKAATLLIAGWNDGYANPPLRIYNNLKVPKKLLYGPWSHTYPNTSHCPRIDIYYELLRWWDRWLKDMDNGVDAEPGVHVYLREFEEPRPDRRIIKGEWKTDSALPIEKQTLFCLPSPLVGEGLGVRRLGGAPSETSGSASVKYLPAACRNGGLWDAGVPFCQSGPQNADEAHAINFTSPLLEQDLVILGQPQITLFCSSDVPVVPIAVRLTEVGPDGTSILVTRGILNVTRRNGMDRAEPLPVNTVTKLEFELEATSWKFTRGNCVRISINGSDFPNVWPTPMAGTIHVHFGPQHPSQIKLPVWKNPQKLPFDFRPSPNDARGTGLGSAPWQIVHHVLEDEYRFCMTPGNEICVSNRRPAVAYVKGRQSQSCEWPGHKVRSEAIAALTSDEQTFNISIALNVYLNDALYFQKQWSNTVKREWM
ncbi:MAG TPA: CocE/NonD family hydrolase [Planctomycetota bacterium]|nr:CocE/NonD family hydrolase [Planctomycetota bacterium]